jgi:hypothetical protein
MTEETTVSVVGYAYEVKDAYGKTHAVSKDKTCTCGKEGGCWHINAVKKYLNAGGQKAPDVPPLNTEHIEALFTGEMHWTSRCTQAPYKNPYSIKAWAQWAVNLKAKQAKMNADGAQNKLGAVGQYYHDLRTMRGSAVQDKWNLNEPPFGVKC